MDLTAAATHITYLGCKTRFNHVDYKQMPGTSHSATPQTADVMSWSKNVDEIKQVLHYTSCVLFSFISYLLPHSH
jgi:hypothetical protein